MEMKDYLLFVSQKLDEAARKGDKQEWIRLANVLIDALKEEIEKLEK